MQWNGEMAASRPSEGANLGKNRLFWGFSVRFQACQGVPEAVVKIGMTIAYCVGDRGTLMIVASGLAIFVVVCLLVSMVQTPPAIGQ